MNKPHILEKLKLTRFTRSLPSPGLEEQHATAETFTKLGWGGLISSFSVGCPIWDKQVFVPVYIGRKYYKSTCGCACVWIYVWWVHVHMCVELEVNLWCHFSSQTFFGFFQVGSLADQWAPGDPDKYVHVQYFYYIYLLNMLMNKYTENK